MEYINRDVRGCEMSYDEFKQICRESWKEEYNYLSNNRSKKRVQGSYCIFIERKNTYFDCTPKTKAL